MESERRLPYDKRLEEETATVIRYETAALTAFVDSIAHKKRNGLETLTFVAVCTQPMPHTTSTSTSSNDANGHDTNNSNNNNNNVVPPAARSIFVVSYHFFELLEKDAPLFLSFMRSLLHYIEVERKAVNYHINIEDRFDGFRARVFFNTESSPRKFLDPASAPPCIGCPGPNGYDEDQRALLVSQSAWHNVWIDKKLRPLFVVTPMTHKELLSIFSDVELLQFYQDARDTLRRELGHTRFETLKLNLGDFRNVPHLHLKVWLKDVDFFASPSWLRYAATASGLRALAAQAAKRAQRAQAHLEQPKA